MISLKNANLRFAEKVILKNINLQLPEASRTVLLGPSGCGKSTVLRVLAGLLELESGDLTRSAGKTSFVFQEPRLLPWLNVAENIELPLKLGKSHAVSKNGLNSWLQRVRLQDAVKKYPHQLSGGMRMRTAIARAMITEPQLLLLDEPFAALDEIQRHALQDLLLQLQIENKITLVFVTHSIQEAVYVGQNILMMLPDSNAGEGAQIVPITTKAETISFKRNSIEYVQRVAEVGQIYQTAVAQAEDRSLS